MSRYPTTGAGATAAMEIVAPMFARDDKGRLYCIWCCFRVGRHHTDCPRFTPGEPS